jgi:internalin A
MKTTVFPLTCFLILIFLSEDPLCGQSTNTETSIFPDKNLEAAVRKYVFEKRETTKPITEADVANLSTIHAPGAQIKDLTGLEKCRSLASLDLAKNNITNIASLKELANVQYLNLADNQVEDISPLQGMKALQYIELSNNRVKEVSPLTSLTNLTSLYLSNNKVTDISPLLNLKRLWSLYLDNNGLQSIQGIATVTNLSSLSLNKNRISDLSALEGLHGLYYLFLENNKISDTTPLIKALKKDFEGEKRFAPYINIFLAGNPLNSSSKKQVSAMKEQGVRINL